MSFTAGAITGTIELDEEPAVKAMRHTAVEAEQMRGTVEKSAQNASQGLQDKFKGALKNISADFGKKSLLGAGLKLAAGGGAIGGLSLLAREVADVGEAIGKTADRFRDGELKFGGLVFELLQGLPVMGSVIRFAEGIAEAWTGAARAEQLAKEEAKKHADEAARMVKDEQDAADRRKAAQGSGQTFTAAVSQMRGEQRTNNAPDDFSRKIREENDRFNKQQEDLVKKRNEGLNNAGADNVTIQALQKSVDDYNRIIEKAGGEGNVGEGLLKGRDRDKQLLEDAQKNKKTIEDNARTALAVAESVHDQALTKLQNTKYFDSWKKGWEDMKKQGIEAFNALQKQNAEEGKSLKEAQRTPLEQINDAMAETRRLFSGGFIDQETLNRQLNGARAALQEITAPNLSRLQAEEIGGHKTVTAQDQGLAGVEKNTQATVEEIQKLQEISKQAGNGAPKLIMLSMPG